MLETISTKYCQNFATFFSLNDLLHRWTQYYLCYLNLGYLDKQVGEPRPMRPSGSATYVEKYVEKSLIFVEDLRQS